MSVLARLLFLGLLLLPQAASAVPISASCGISGGVNLSYTCGSLGPSSLSLANTHLFVGNSSGAAADVAMSGDCTMANTGAITCTQGNAGTGTFTAGSFIPTSSSVPTNGMYLPSANTPTIAANSAIVAQFLSVASPNSWINIVGGGTGARPSLQVAGAASDINFGIYSKGTGSIFLYTNAGSNTALEVANTASAVDYLQVKGGAAGNPGLVTLSAIGSDTNISMQLTAKGSGSIRPVNPLVLVYDAGVTSGFKTLFTYVRAGSTCGAVGGYHAQGSFADGAWYGASMGNNCGSYFTTTGSAGATINNLTLLPDGTSTAFVGIGTTTPVAALDVIGDVRLSSLTTDATHTDASVCWDTTSFQLYFGSGTLGICLGTSSARYKRDIHPLTDGLPEVMKLKPVRFFYKKGHGDNGAKENYGLIAEDVVKVMPKLVGRDKDGEPSTVDLLGLVPVLVKTVQEQQEEIAKLKYGVKSHKCFFGILVCAD